MVIYKCQLVELRSITGRLNLILTDMCPQTKVPQPQVVWGYFRLKG